MNRPARSRSDRRSRVPGVLLIVALLVVWQLATMGREDPSAVLPSLSTVVERWVALLGDGSLLTQLAQTLGVTARGYLIGCAGGIVLGTLMGQSRAVWSLAEPLVELLRPVPIAAAVPLLILFFGIESGLKVAAITIASFFPVLINTYSGVRGVPPTLRDTTRTFGLGRAATIGKIVLPHALPSILVGMRLALSISLVVAVFTEMISGNSGVGYFILSSQQSLTITDLYVGVLTLAVIGYLLNLLFLAVESFAIGWHESSPRRRAAR